MAVACTTSRRGLRIDCPVVRRALRKLPVAAAAESEEEEEAGTWRGCPALLERRWPRTDDDRDGGYSSSPFDETDEETDERPTDDDAPRARASDE